MLGELATYSVAHFSKGSLRYLAIRSRRRRRWKWPQHTRVRRDRVPSSASHYAIIALFIDTYRADFGITRGDYLHGLQPFKYARNRQQLQPRTPNNNQITITFTARNHHRHHGLRQLGKIQSIDPTITTTPFPYLLSPSPYTSHRHAIAQLSLLEQNDKINKTHRQENKEGERENE